MDPARVARAIEAWQPLSPEPLTEADAEEIIEHMAGYFEVLRRWKEAADRRLPPREAVGSACVGAPKPRRRK